VFADIGSATNIVFTNGDLDPWSGGGVGGQLIHCVTVTIPDTLSWVSKLHAFCALAVV